MMYDNYNDGGIQYYQSVQQQENTVPNINQMASSKYLKCADIPDPLIVTVQGVKQVNMAKEDEAPELKWAIKFRELDKPMILNSTNMHVAAKVFQSDETDDWKGKEIILYTDPNVSFGSQVVGGLRFRGQEKAPVRASPTRPAAPVAPRPATPARPASVVSHDSGFSDMPDDIPWDDEPGSRG